MPNEVPADEAVRKILDQNIVQWKENGSDLADIQYLVEKIVFQVLVSRQEAMAETLESLRISGDCKTAVLLNILPQLRFQVKAKIRTKSERSRIQYGSGLVVYPLIAANVIDELRRYYTHHRDKCPTHKGKKECECGLTKKLVQLGDCIAKLSQ